MFMSGMSTIQCASVVTETINYYLHNKSDIYICTIDASKAFNRVTLFVLFKLLRKRNFKRISSFKWDKIGRGIITIVILGIFR